MVNLNLFLSKTRSFNTRSTILYRPSFVILFLFLLNGCNLPTAQNESNSIPVVTGIIETTEIQPSGTGRIFGDPSYSNEWIQAVPNPYSPTINKSPFEKGSPIVYLTNLPQTCTIKIVKATYEKRNPIKQTYSLEAVNEFTSIRTIEHNSENIRENIKWDLTDSYGVQVQSGFYRVFFISGDDDEINWVDLYLILDNSWKDPTGWFSL